MKEGDNHKRQKKKKKVGWIDVPGTGNGRILQVIIHREWLSGDSALVIFNAAVEVQLCCRMQSFCTSAQHTACDGQSPLRQWDSPNRCFSACSMEYFVL